MVEMIPQSLSAVRLPTQSARIMRNSLLRHDVSWNDICKDARVEALAIEHPGAKIYARDEWRLQTSVANATAGDARAWYEMGSRYCLTAYGTWGLALLSAETVADAVTIATSYQELTYSLLSYHPLRDDGGKIRGLTVDESNVPESLREFCLVRDLGALRRMHDGMISGPFPFESVSLTIPKPAGWDEFGRDYGCRVEFGAERAMWTFAKGAGSRRLPMADAMSAETYVEQCRQEVNRGRLARDIGGALAEFLRGSKGPTPSVEEAARHLGLSKRTLNRRLAEQNLNFSLILDQSRRQRAEKLLLMHEGMSIEAIGEMLGYAETASFTRAFKRWNGTAPLRFRRQRLADFDAAH